MVQREKELEQVVATLWNELEAKKAQDDAVSVILFPKQLLWHQPLQYPQRMNEIGDELSCDVCAGTMWTPYRHVLIHFGSFQWLTTVV